jgi:hypothetical protein
LKQSKNKTAYIEETQRNQLVNGEIKEQLKELEDLRHENAELSKRYGEMEKLLA